MASCSTCPAPLSTGRLCGVPAPSSTMGQGGKRPACASGVQTAAAAGAASGADALATAAALARTCCCECHSARPPSSRRTTHSGRPPPGSRPPPSTRMASNGPEGGWLSSHPLAAAGSAPLPALEGGCNWALETSVEQGRRRGAVDAAARRRCWRISSCRLSSATIDEFWLGHGSRRTTRLRQQAVAVSAGLLSSTRLERRIVHILTERTVCCTAVKDWEDTIWPWKQGRSCGSSQGTSALALAFSLTLGRFARVDNSCLRVYSCHQHLRFGLSIRRTAIWPQQQHFIQSSSSGRGTNRAFITACGCECLPPTADALPLRNERGRGRRVRGRRFRLLGGGPG